MTHYKIVRVSDLAIVASYDDMNPFGGALSGSDGTMVSVAVPNGINPNGVLAQLDGGMIVLVFDQSTLNSWKRQQNQAALASYTSLRSSQCDNTINADLASATGMDADNTTHLMITAYAHDVLAFPNAWLQTLLGDTHNGSVTIINLPNTVTIQKGDLVTGPNIPSSTYVTDILTSTSIRISNPATADATSQNISFDPTPVAQALLATYRPVFVQIKNERDQRDTDIANFSPPYSDVSPLYPS